jgi:uncharacterized protein
MLQIGSKSKGNQDASWQALLTWLRARRNVIVLTSGGVDSCLLLAAAARSGANKILAVTADSPSLAREELRRVASFVEFLGIEHSILQTEELQDSRYVENSGDRCYFCKKALYEAVERLLPTLRAQYEEFVIVDGTNSDDLLDHRPSLPASREHGVRHPYVELGINKSTIRDMARTQGLPFWNKPAMACLSSRIQDGISVSQEKLRRVEAAEEVLRSCGLTIARVRYHESGSGDFARTIARIEVSLDEIPIVADTKHRTLIIDSLRLLGFDHVTLDLAGYRKGNR